MNSTAASLEALAQTPKDDVLDGESERIHRQMLSSVSHDLKTPLASIIGSLEIFERMKDKLPPGKQAELIGVALQEAYRLDRFITNILDMAKLENGLVKAKPERVDINGLTQDCLIRLGHRLRHCKVEVKPAARFEVLADSVLLGRVVCLVLDNAVKYGGNPAAIAIAYDRDGSAGFIHISDNGAGIPEARREAVFEKYTRFAKGDQQNAGTGLGLAIARELMRLMGGAITVANSEEGGALFRLRVPVYQEKTREISATSAD